jgi:TM2 domain-containing membrane protein YozV
MASDEVVKLKAELSQQQLGILSSEMEKHKKSAGVAYVLWFFLGTLGIHKFYLGRAGVGVVYLLLGVAAWISLGVGIAAATDAGIGAGMLVFIVLISVLGILLLVDLFSIGRQIRKNYEKKELEAIHKIRSAATGGTS